MKNLITSVLVSIGVLLSAGVASADQYNRYNHHYKSDRGHSDYRSNKYQRHVKKQRPSVIVKKQNDNGDAVAAIAGLVGGIILGTALSENNNSRVYVAPRNTQTPSYFPPKPSKPHVSMTQNTFGEPWSREWKNYCKAKYRSFNVQTGTFLGYDGKNHFCVMNR